MFSLFPSESSSSITREPLARPPRFGSVEGKFDDGDLSRVVFGGKVGVSALRRGTLAFGRRAVELRVGFGGEMGAVLVATDPSECRGPVTRVGELFSLLDLKTRGELVILVEGITKRVVERRYLNGWCAVGVSRRDK